MGFRTSSNLIGNTLFWMVVALSALTVWTLMGTLRHMRRRSQIQKTLVQETNFRRAMENSMLTGMRTIDLEGRITYVNPAFCAMTGFSEEELIGCVPPYPYWPKDRLDEFNRMFQQELLGRSPMGGIEVVMQRRDGSQFDARMYVSPLIDIGGLKRQAAVKSAGVVVGRVQSITFDTKTYQAQVEITLNKGVAFPKDTSAKILTAGLLGEQYIGLEPGYGETNLAAGDTIKSTQSAIVLENLISQFLYSKAADGNSGKEGQK